MKFGKRAIADNGRFVGRCDARVKSDDETGKTVLELTFTDEGSVSRSYFYNVIEGYVRTLGTGAKIIDVKDNAQTIVAILPCTPANYWRQIESMLRPAIIGGDDTEAEPTP